VRCRLKQLTDEKEKSQLEIAHLQESSNKATGQSVPGLASIQMAHAWGLLISRDYTVPWYSKGANRGGGSGKER